MELTAVAQRTVLSKNAVAMLVPILEKVVGWDQPQIRDFFERNGFLVQECGWNGLMVDANRHKVDTIKLRFSGHAATVVKHRVTRDDVNELLETHGERFPALATALGSAAERREEMDQAWEFGLERILDGLGVLIEQRGG